MEKGREKLLLGRRRGSELERAAGGEGKEKSCSLPRLRGAAGGDGPAPSREGGLTGSRCPYAETQTRRAKPLICKAAVLTRSLSSAIPARKASRCQTLTPPSHAPAFFCTPGRFFQLAPNLHRCAVEQPRRGSRSTSVDTLPPPNRIMQLW